MKKGFQAALQRAAADLSGFGAVFGFQALVLLDHFAPHFFGRGDVGLAQRQLAVGVFGQQALAALAAWAAGGPQGQGESARQNQMVVEESLGRSVASVVLMEALLQVKLVLRVASAQPRWELLVLSARSVFQAHQVQREH